MTRPYTPYARSRTDRLDSPNRRDYPDQPDDDYGTYPPYGDAYEENAHDGYRDGYQDAYQDAYEEDAYEEDAYAEYEDYDDAPLDRRWIWVAGVAGAVLLVAVICTVVILGGGDSGSVSATVSPQATSSQPATTSAAPPAASTSAAPPTSLAPETITTVSPSPSATAAPAPVPTEAAPPPPPAPNPRTITYRVTGNRQLIDLVTVIYTDERGALQTDLNVALPWAKTVVLDPGVELSSVTATSVAGQLNCSITDANGAVIAQHTNNTMIATCTK